jgi:hypothetical protein
LSEPTSSHLPATIAIAMGIGLFATAPFLITHASQRSAEASQACVATDLPVIAAEPERLARLMGEIEASNWRADCVLARYRMTPEGLDTTMERVQSNPDRQARYRAERAAQRQEKQD